MSLEDKKLSDVFNDLWEIHFKITNNTEGSTSDKVQQLIKEALGLHRLLSQSIEQLAMFSKNEDLDEISTSDLKYFLLPALAADITSHTKCDIHQRLAVLKECQQFYAQYLKACRDYGFGNLSEINHALACKSQEDSDAVRIGGTGKPDLQAMSATRDAKIKKYQLEQSRVKKLKNLEKHLHDDASCREYWLLQIQQWIDSAVKELSSLQTELSMLERMQNVPRADIERSRQEARKGSGVKPFMLTKDKMQSTVFGAGYPSVPTVTLEEFFEREAAACRLPDQMTKPAVDKPRDENDGDDDIDNMEKLNKQRALDDWKDDHRRGAGNRHNMG